MKKLAALLLAAAMAFTCVACGGNAGNAGNSGNSGNGGSTEIKDATEILTKAWEEYNNKVSEDYKFPVGGGNIENFELIVSDNAGKCDLTLEGAKDAVSVSYCIPLENLEMVDDCGNMMNMMMANNFSAAAYHVTDSENVEKVVAGIKEATMNNMWMCGMPDTLIIVTIGDYVVSAFGNGEVIEYFKTAITTVYANATVAVEENLAQ